MNGFKLRRCSLKCEEACANPQTFSSGERGPRGAVNEEDIIAHYDRQAYILLFLFFSACLFAAVYYDFLI
jgi:hypothetical protein